MAADFFERQDVARRSTTRLVVLFGLAVVGMIVAIDLLLSGVLGYLGRDPLTGAIDWGQALDPGVLLLATVGTLLVVSGGSLSKIAQLRGGGHVVAEQLGGRRLDPGTASPAERQLLNVVDEMAIASGVPAPPVFLLEQEEGINAFAAGFAPGDAVIGVTRGTVERLNRDELQGVIAHEFSHILNGDMRLNIRLMGLLHGILIIGMLGYFILRMTVYSGRGYRSRRSRDGGNAMPLVAFAFGLMVVGFVGTFFGNLIKASVSRQRERLADASAVQFTRQPMGIANALKKILGLSAGSIVHHPNAPEASHMFFGRATTGLNALFSTHPPLEERIRALDPSWNGELPAGDVPPLPSPAAAPAGASGFVVGAARPARVADAVASIGQVGDAHLQQAAALIGQLPAEARRAAHEPYGARALVYALLVNESPESTEAQLARLEQEADADVYAETRALLPTVAGVARDGRLPLVELSLPALRALTPPQYARFRDNVTALVHADARISLFEWALQRGLLRDLDIAAGHRRPARVRQRSLARLLPQVDVLLSALARAGDESVDGAERAFAAAQQRLGRQDVPLGADGSGLDALDAALDELEEATPAIKRQVLEAAAACVAADEKVTAAEADLLRAIAASLDCPIPLLVSRQA